MNKIVLTGNLVADPEIRQAGDATVCNFRLAVRKQHSLKEGEPNADFFNCTAWNGDANFLAQYGAKGRMVAVEGRLQNREYVDKEGQTRRVTDVVVNHLELIGSRTDGDSKPEPQNKTRPTAPRGSYAGSEDELPF